MAACTKASGGGGGGGAGGGSSSSSSSSEEVVYTTAIPESFMLSVPVPCKRKETQAAECLRSLGLSELEDFLKDGPAVLLELSRASPVTITLHAVPCRLPNLEGAARADLAKDRQRVPRSRHAIARAHLRS